MLNYVFAAAAEAAPTQGSQGLITLIMLGALLVFMYFFMIRPQKKQEKEAAEMRNSLRVGDEITTIGGIIGKIVSIKDPTCIIETGRDGTRIRILKSAVKTVDVPASVTVAPVKEKNEEQTEEVSDQTENTEGASSENKAKKSKKKK